MTKPKKQTKRRKGQPASKAMLGCEVCHQCPNALDAKRYRALRRMVGPLSVTLGDPLYSLEFREPNELRADLDAELDRKSLEFGDPLPEQPNAI